MEGYRRLHLGLKHDEYGQEAGALLSVLLLHLVLVLDVLDKKVIRTLLLDIKK